MGLRFGLELGSESELGMEGVGEERVEREAVDVPVWMLREGHFCRRNRLGEELLDV